MAIITFWSQNNEETAKTLSIAAISTAMSIEHNYKVLVISTKRDDDTLENCFWEKKENKSLLGKITGGRQDLDTGINGLTKAILSNKITPELITNYTKIVFKGRLELIGGPKNIIDEDYIKIKEIYKELILTANKYYDYVFVDLDKTLNDTMVTDVLEVSDVIIVNLTQKLNVIDEYIKLRTENQLFKGNNIMPLLGRYDKFSKYNSKNITRYIGEKREISKVPYNTLFFESCNEGKVADYFIRLRKISSTDRNAVFIEDVKQTVENIIYKVQELHLRY